jgi:hypothetical protein
MSVKKLILYRILDRARSDPRWMKKAVMIASIAVLSFVVIAGFLAFLAITSIKDMVTSTPDRDLIALRELISNKVLVLTERQKSAMLPLVQKLSERGLSAEVRADAKAQLYDLLEPDQKSRVDAWKSEAARKSAQVDTIPLQILSAIERYTGLSMKSLSTWTDALSAWWKVKKPEDSAGRLADELTSSK